MKKRKRILWILVVFLIGGALSALLAMNKKQVQENPGVQELRKVITYSIEPGNITRFVQGQGYIESAEQLHLISQVSGEVRYSLEGLKEGVSFNEGDLLLQVDRSSIDSQVQLAETELLKSLSMLLSALSSQGNSSAEKWQSLRSLILQSDNLPALPAMESERERLFVSQYGVLDYYYQLKELQRNRDLHRVIAPFDGLVQRGNHPRGAMIVPGQEIAHIINPVRLESRVSLTRDEAEYLAGSTDPVVKIYPADNRDIFLPGRIVRFSGFVDPRSQTLTLTLAFENPQAIISLLPGSYVDILIEGDSVEGALSIPRELINRDDTLNFLVDGKLKKIPVTILGYHEGRAIVKGEELSSGMELILTRLQVPIEGMELERLEEAESL